jgi:hypothetical protein
MPNSFGLIADLVHLSISTYCSRKSAISFSGMDLAGMFLSIFSKSPGR